MWSAIGETWELELAQSMASAGLSGKHSILLSLIMYGEAIIQMRKHCTSTLTWLTPGARGLPHGKAGPWGQCQLKAPGPSPAILCTTRRCHRTSGDQISNYLLPIISSTKRCLLSLLELSSISSTRKSYS